MPTYQTKIIDFQIHVCPSCGQPHHYKLKVFSKDVATNIVLFGGPGDQSEVMFECTQTKKMFTYQVPVPENTEIAGVATVEEIDKYNTEQLPANSSSEELKEWIKNSRGTALDFCKTMLSTSLGAIPVYFAILKYLGSDKLDASEKFFILPPVLFLLAALLYVFGLKPKFKIFEIITEDDFSNFKKGRLKQLNNCLVIGTSLFIAGTISAILIFLSSF